MAGLKLYIQRDLEATIREYLLVKEIIALVGVRQCGKTTLLKKIIDDLSKDGKRVNSVSFDDVSVLRIFEEDIDSFIQIHINAYDVLFIDEIQYSKESGKKLKFIYDKFDIKIFVSGSSAPEIAVQSIKFLVGRIFTFTLSPFSFREFLRFKNKNILSVYDSGEYKKTVTGELNKYLNEFLLYGGFPRVVTSNTVDEKKIVLRNIYNTYLLREIRDIFQIGNDFKILKLIKLIALQMGNLVNYNQLSMECEIGFNELKSILNILQKTYIISFCQPFYTNKRTEIIKSPKVYFVDSGFRNICLENFSDSVLSTGEIFEQFVFSEFQKRDLFLKFWRTKSQAEVDFIWENQEIVPIEIKSSLKRPKISRSFHSFLSKYESKTAYILSENFEEEIELNSKTKLQFLPWVKTNKIK